MVPTAPSDPPALRFIRNVVLALVALGTTAMCVELTLIAHYEDANQSIPLALGGAGVLVVLWVSRAPGLASLRTLQFVMLLYAAAGVIGITLHFKANAEFQREIDPALGGMALVRKVVTATAPPALAPGLLVQLGLLGLVYTYKHPALGEAGLADRDQR